jgi:hypothetical protein
MPANAEGRIAEDGCEIYDFRNTVSDMIHQQIKSSFVIRFCLHNYLPKLRARL